MTVAGPMVEEETDCDVPEVVDWRDVLLRPGGCGPLEGGPGPLAEEMLQQPHGQPGTEAQPAALSQSEEEGESGLAWPAVVVISSYCQYCPLMLDL